MRIGIMLRHYDQHGGGVRVYTHRILRAMLDLKTAHEFVFLYKNPALVGTYAKDEQVTEVALPGDNILWWDQIEVPRAIKQARHRRVVQPEVLPAAARRLPHRLGVPWLGLVRDAVGIAAHRSLEPQVFGAALRAKSRRDHRRLADHP